MYGGVNYKEGEKGDGAKRGSICGLIETNDKILISVGCD